MKKTSIVVGLLIVAVCNAIGAAALYLAKNMILEDVSFQSNLGNLGSSLVTYSTAMMALLIAMLIVVFSMDDNRLARFKKSGYLHVTYLIYMFTFFELGLTMGLSFLCLSNIQSIKIASLSLTLALITFLLIGCLGIQLLNMKKNN